MKKTVRIQKNRLLWLDFGRAMGILVVLLVHAGCSLGLVTFYGGMFYMPVFFVAAGYTYRCRPKERPGVFLRNKARRLLRPYFGTSFFLWLFFWAKDVLLFGTSESLDYYSLFGIFYARSFLWNPESVGPGKTFSLMTILNSPLWFLPALFLAYAWYDRISRSRRKHLWLLTGFLAAFAWHRFTGRLLPWSLDAAPYFACFLAVGEWLREKKVLEWLRIHWYAPLLLFVTFLVSGWSNGTVNLSCGQYGGNMLLYLFIGSAGSVLLFLVGMLLERMSRRAAVAFAWLGQRTLPILCFHMFTFMFIKTGAAFLGLGDLLTKILLVLFGLLVPAAGNELLHRGIAKFEEWRQS